MVLVFFLFDMKLTSKLKILGYFYLNTNFKKITSYKVPALHFRFDRCHVTTTGNKRSLGFIKK
jgi:hypothetical protein